MSPLAGGGNGAGSPSNGVTGAGDPVFVVAAARSGSTLLRVLLDAHPDLACPPESMVAKLCAALEQTWHAVLGHGGIGELPPPTLARIRAAACEPLMSYASARGKARWCDKSLGNVHLHPLLRRVFPDAQFVCLFRHALDMVASGLEAAPWGFGAYGFEEYVRASPGNTVRALVTYWCDHTERILALRDTGDRCTTIRYEDLVRAPDTTMAALVAGLGLAPEPDLVTRAFDGAHDLGGGDHKLPFTDRVSDRSVGRGRRVPVRVIDDPLLDRMNANLDLLGYPPVDREWNHQLPDDPVGDHPRPPEPPGGARAPALPPPGNQVDPCDHDPVARDHRVLVVIEDQQEAWAVDLRDATVRRCSERCGGAGRLLGDLAPLRAVVDGRLNLGGALRTGQLRATGRTTSITRAIDAIRTAAAMTPRDGRRHVVPGLTGIEWEGT